MSEACEIKRKIVKFTVFSEEHLEKILELTTDKHEQKVTKIVSKSGDSVTVSKHGVTKGLLKLLERDGYTIESAVTYGRRGKREICGFPVRVRPLNRNNYQFGVIIECLAEGMTDKELNLDGWNKQETLLKLFTKHKIPVDRICMGSLIGCEYKFY